MNRIASIYHFYLDGFRSLSWRGRWLWIMILVKVAVLFLVFKLWLMPPSPLAACDTPEQKADAVRHSLVN